MIRFSTIILTGGKSSRMGRPKSTVKYRGEELIRYPLQLANYFNSPVVIAAGDLVFAQTGLTVVKDLLPVRAPIAGIHAGLKASCTDWNLVLACDMPHVTADFISLLLPEAKTPVKLVMPFHDGYPEPLCALYHRDLAAEIEVLSREQKFSPLDLLDRTVHEKVMIDLIMPGMAMTLFRNINTPADLEG